jgi:hypothetical protein
MSPFQSSFAVTSLSSKSARLRVGCAHCSSGALLNSSTSGVGYLSTMLSLTAVRHCVRGTWSNFGRDVVARVRSSSSKPPSKLALAEWKLTNPNAWAPNHLPLDELRSRILGQATHLGLVSALMCGIGAAALITRSGKSVRGLTPPLAGE